MDDEALRRRLRVVDGDFEPRPEFVEDLHRQLADRLASGRVIASPDGPLLPPAARPLGTTPPARRRGGATGAWRLLAAAVTTAFVGAMVVAGIGSFSPPPQESALLRSLRMVGAVRIAIDPADPQAMGPSRQLSGFDVDVARELARRLGLHADLVVTPGSKLFDSREAWTLALPGRPLQAAEAALAVEGRPYAAWPLYLLGGDGLASLADLAGAQVCAVESSAGAAWLRGDGAAYGLLGIRAVPRVAGLRTATDDDACLLEVADGRAGAMVTDQLLKADVASRGGVRLLDDAPVALRPRSVIVSATSDGVSGLTGDIDRVVTEMLEDGTLAARSRQRFAGDDLTIGLATPSPAP